MNYFCSREGIIKPLQGPLLIVIGGKWWVANAFSMLLYIGISFLHNVAVSCSMYRKALITAVLNSIFKKSWCTCMYTNRWFQWGLQCVFSQFFPVESIVPSVLLNFNYSCSSITQPIIRRLPTRREGWVINTGNIRKDKL